MEDVHETERHQHFFWPFARRRRESANGGHMEAMHANFANKWWIDAFEELDQAVEANDLFERICKLARALGFAYCSYGLRFPVAIEPSPVRIFDSYPSGWMSHYVSAKYVLVDPSVRAAANTRDLVVWSDDLFTGSGSLWADARDHGLRVGVAQSSWTSPGLFGLVSFARPSGELSETELRELKPRLQWITENAHRKMTALLPTSTQEHVAPLSEREREVLRWTASGKTAWEVSRILGISESTVVFHLKNAMSKLGSQTKVQAVAKATALGLIFSADVDLHYSASVAAGHVLEPPLLRATAAHELEP